MKKAGTTTETTESILDFAGGEAVPQIGHFNESGTRQTVARLLLEKGPITTVAVAEELGLSAAAVRRHVDALVAAGEAEGREASRRRRRGRGRPAKLYLLTEEGRARFGHAYDDLAVAALGFLAEHAGTDAVYAFARRRMAAILERHRDEFEAETDLSKRAEVLADVLTREGYAASTHDVGESAESSPGSEQLCQHHCPVAHVAADFPQLCEAETQAFAEVLGTHVQRLATIARGDAVCTTHIPRLPRQQQNRSTPIPDGGELE